MTREWLRSPRALRLVFGAVMVASSALLVFLGWQTIEQDSRARLTRALERDKAAADLAAERFDARLGAVDQALDRILVDAEPAKDLVEPPGAVLVRLSPSGTRAWPAGRLLFAPNVDRRLPADVALFDQSDALEFQ